MWEKDKGNSKKKKEKKAVMSNGLILHREHSGTYLSQQGEAGEG